VPAIGSAAKALLPKLAHKENLLMTTTTMARPSLQDMLKAAADATAYRVDVAAEAARQQGIDYASEDKTASAADAVPTDVVHRYATALEYTAKTATIDLAAGTAAGVGPGAGPNALRVTETDNVGTVARAGLGVPAKGGKVRGTVLPTSEAGEKSAAALYQRNIGALAKLASMQDDYDDEIEARMYMHGEDRATAQAKHMRKNKNLLGGMLGGYGALLGGGGMLSGGAGAVPALATAAALGAAGYVGGRALAEHAIAPSAALHSKRHGGSKHASVLFEGNLAALRKLAEDAINPAQISASTHAPGSLPRGVSQAGENAPRVPAQVASRAAIENLTRRQAKAPARADVVAMSMAGAGATDDTAGQAFANTSGTKVASLTRTAACRALLQNLAKEAEAQL
jgi:hypothetical protein